MAVLVIGGAGFIGSHLVDELLTQRFEVMVVDDLSTGVLGNLERWKGNEKLEFVRADINEGSTMARAVDHKSWVFNFAPVHIPTLADVCAAAGVRRLVDNSGGGEGCDLWEQELPVVSFQLDGVYGPRGPKAGKLFVSDVVRANMFAAMDREIQGLKPVDEVIFWTKVDEKTGAQIIETYEKVMGSSIIIASR